jgi:hypothetical protein
MKVAFGLKAHSGWAALIAMGESGGALHVVERRRIELVEPDDRTWARQPYHAAHGLDPEDARDVVERGVTSACRVAGRELRAALERARAGGHDVVGCAVLVAEPMPAWSTEQILAVHFRMHKAEGVLFPEALARAASECGLRLVAIPEKRSHEYAEQALATPASLLAEQIAKLGKSVGAPWGKDQKSAALAARIALQGRCDARAAPELGMRAGRSTSCRPRRPPSRRR